MAALEDKLEGSPLDNQADYPSPTEVDDQLELEQMIYARHAEIRTTSDLEAQRGTPIPALFNQFYKFIQNPSTVSVETYKRMVDTDDTIGSGIDFLTTCLAARLGKYQHPNALIADHVNKALERLEGGWTNTLKELLGAAWSGFMVGEKVWANDDVLGFIIKKIVCLPPVSILFETERTGELTSDGILQYQRNYNPANMAYGVGSLFGFAAGARNGSVDPYARFGDAPFPLRTANSYSYLSIRIPVLKCVHYAFDAAGKLGNPYGRSLLRRAYKWWVMKDAFLQMLSVALDRKGTPLTVVFADPNTTLGNPDKIPAGAPNAGRGNAKVGERADAAARRAFANVHNDSTIILPGKKGQIFDLDFVPQASNAADFMAAIDLCNKSIMRAMLVPSLIFSNGDGTGSYALGQEHAKTFDKILDGMLDGFKQVLLQQVIRELVAYNFPEQVWKKDGLGSFAKVELSPDEVQKEMEILEKANSIGAIDMNSLADLNAIRSKIRMEPLAAVPKRPDPMLNGESEDGTPFGKDGGEGGDGKGDDGKEPKQQQQKEPQEGAA